MGSIVEAGPAAAAIRPEEEGESDGEALALPVGPSPGCGACCSRRRDEFRLILPVLHWLVDFGARRTCAKSSPAGRGPRAYHAEPRAITIPVIEFRPRAAQGALLTAASGALPQKPRSPSAALERDTSLRNRTDVTEGSHRAGPRREQGHLEIGRHSIAGDGRRGRGRRCRPSSETLRIRTVVGRPPLTGWLASARFWCFRLAQPSCASCSGNLRRLGPAARDVSIAARGGARWEQENDRHRGVGRHRVSNHFLPIAFQEVIETSSWPPADQWLERSTG